MIHFKIHIQKKLEDYENFVDEEVSREVAGDNNNADDSLADDAGEAAEQHRDADYDGFGDDAERR